MTTIPPGTTAIGSIDPDDRASLVAGLQTMSAQIATLEHTVDMLSIMLGMSIALAENKNYPIRVSLSGALAAILEMAEANGIGARATDNLRAGMKVGSEHPEPDGTSTGKIVQLFETVIAKAA